MNIYKCGGCSYKDKNIREFIQLKDIDNETYYMLCLSCMNSLNEYESEIEEEEDEQEDNDYDSEEYD